MTTSLQNDYIFAQPSKYVATALGERIGYRILRLRIGYEVRGAITTECL